MRHAWLRVAFVCSILLSLVVTVSASAATTLTPTISEFSEGLNAGSSPNGVTTGPDGNVWFTDKGTTPAIGYVTPAGTVVEFSAGLNSGSQPGEITTGPDGNLWFTDTGSTAAIGRITPQGVITEFSSGLNGGAEPSGIAAGPDGRLWFSDSGSTGALGTITAGGAINEFTAGLNAGANPSGITAGPDGNLWFADDGLTTAIGKVTTSQVVTEFSSGLNPGSSPSYLTAGPDGNVWFTDGGSTPAIGRITPQGAITEFSAGLNAGAVPLGITTGSDGYLWFADSGSVSGAIGRVSVTGEIVEYGTNQDEVGSPVEIANGSDGNLWFSDPDGAPAALGQITTPPEATTGAATVLGAGAANLFGVAVPNAQQGTYRFDYGLTTGYGSKTAANGYGPVISSVDASGTASGLSPATTYHYRLVVDNGTGTTPGADAAFTTLALPKLSAVSVKPRIWRLGSKWPRISKRVKYPTGSTISFTLDRPVLVELKFSLKQRGQLKAGKCKRASSPKRGKRCTLLTSAGRLFFNAHPGTNTVRFDGRFSRYLKLSPGDYQVEAIAKDLTVSQKVSQSAPLTITSKRYKNR